MSAAELVQAIYLRQESDSQACIVRQRLATLDESGPRAGSKSPEFPGLHMWSIGKSQQLQYAGKVYVPRIEKLRYEVYHRHHDDMLAGHYGPKRTMELIRRTFNWSGCSKEVKEWCGTCLPCQPNKPVRHKPYGELVSLPIPVRIWGDITMDFVTDLPPSVEYTGGTYDAIWVVVDHLSKMAHYVPVCKTIDAPDLAGLFIQEVV